MKTTFNKILRHLPPASLASLGPYTSMVARLQAKQKVDFDHDQEISILSILDRMGIDAALTFLDAVDGYDKEKRLLAVTFVNQISHLIESQVLDSALEVAEAFALGKATRQELHEAHAQAKQVQMRIWHVARAVTWATSEDAAVAARCAALDARSAIRATANNDTLAMHNHEVAQAQELRRVCMAIMQESCS
jgi:hypothetical protein